MYMLFQQVKIWFQNKRSQKRKLENIQNAKGTNEARDSQTPGTSPSTDQKPSPSQNDEERPISQWSNDIGIKSERSSAPQNFTATNTSAGYSQAPIQYPNYFNPDMAPGGWGERDFSHGLHYPTQNMPLTSTPIQSHHQPTAYSQDTYHPPYLDASFPGQYGNPVYSPGSRAYSTADQKPDGVKMEGSPQEPQKETDNLIANLKTWLL